MASSPWQLDGYRARLSFADQLTGSVDLLQPGEGLALRWRDGAPVTAFALDFPAIDPAEGDSVLDAWARAGDLVATYAESQSRKLRGQIYWRAHRDAATGIAAIDLIASVQTSLLDSDPTLNVRSRIAAGEVLQLSDTAPGGLAAIDVAQSEPVHRDRSGDPGCFLFRLADGKSTYIEMVHPADFTESTLQRWPQGEVKLSNRLFPGRLEKGVILRSRLRALFVPRGDDIALAHASYADFAASEPPLTT